MPTPLRIIDANANRAREALRVLEDAARFLLDDPALSTQFKQLRHDLAAALAAFPDLPLHRDTPHDVGTAITTPSESHRPNLASITTAAAKRLTEALRTLEEFAKLPPTPAHLQVYGSARPLQRAGSESISAQLESLRYRAYTLESQLHRRFALPDPRAWKLCVLVTESLCTHHTWLDVAKAALDAGADCIQLREKSLDAADLLDRARQLVALAADYQTRPAIIVNDRLDIALASHAHGVHLGQSDLPLPDARNIAGHRLLIGVSTHNLTEAQRAHKQQADYVGVGAMFPTSTQNRKPAGPRYLRQFLKQFPTLPHLTIGGITPDNIDPLVNAGTRAVAVSSCVCNAPRPDRVVRKLLHALP
ncbi:MAG: thiamine phosphate synthase [Phycisphaerales bacterium]